MVRASDGSFPQPGKLVNTGSARAMSSGSIGGSSSSLPSTRYPTHTDTSGSSASTSSLVSASDVIPDSRAPIRSAGRSSQPQRRGRPVVAPNSPPAIRNLSPASPCSSVGNGPEPTLVAYALVIPTTASIAVGPIPALWHAPAAIVDDEVTYGYVPWSRSRRQPWAPSNSTCSPLAIACATWRPASPVCGASARPAASASSIQRSTSAV